MTIIRGGGGGSFPDDTTITSHNIATHAETLFHYPLNVGDLSDEVGTLGDLYSFDPNRAYPLGVAQSSLVGDVQGWSPRFNQGSNAAAYEDGRSALESPGVTFSQGGTTGWPDSGFTLAWLMRNPMDEPFDSSAYALAFRGASAYGISCTTTSANVVSILFGQSGFAVNANIGYVAQQWNHVAVTVEQGAGNNYTATVYCNGVFVDDLTTLDTAEVNGTKRLLLGTANDTGASFRYNGFLRSIIGIEKVLSAPEILALKNATIGA